MFLRQISDPHLAQYAYLIGCQRTGEAIVIDPERDIDRYRDLAAQEGLRLTAVAETHIHADFVSGARELAAADPEVVLLSDAASAQQTAELVAARPGWGGVAAVRAHRVIPVDPDLTNRPGPRIVDGFELLARALYPDRFPAAAR